MYPPGYHQNGFMATHVLGHMNYACITHELANCITLFGWLVERKIVHWYQQYVTVHYVLKYTSGPKPFC